MKIKAFDLNDIIEDEGSMEYRDDIIKQIKEDIKDKCLYLPDNDSIGFCLIEQKQNIIDSINKYAKEVNLECHFEDVSSFMQDYDWYDISVGEYEIDSREIWNTIYTLLNDKDIEEEFINSKDSNEYFEDLKLRALKIELDKVVAGINREISKAYDEFYKVKRIF